jgi:hemolysin activation/secretion protein
METGRQRLGVALQHSNLFDKDHTLSLAYTTSPDKPSGVDVDIYSLGYRVPMYDIGDSLDFIYGSSTISTPSSTAALGSTLGIVGEGDIYGIRWNHYFMRQGEYSHKLIAGFDMRVMKSTCTAADGSRLTGVAGCEDYTTRPVSLTYAGQWIHPGEMADFSVSLARNLAGGSGGSQASYILAASGRPADTDFTVLRLAGSYVRALPQDWQARVALSGQYADTALTPAEQIGLAGSTTVRGFSERAASADEGVIANLELYTPELAPLLGLSGGNLRLLAFYDWSWGSIHPAAGTTNTSSLMSSIGAGLRYSLKKDIALRLDVARLQEHFPVTPMVEPVDKWNGHINLMLGF